MAYGRMVRMNAISYFRGMQMRSGWTGDRIIDAINGDLTTENPDGISATFAPFGATAADRDAVVLLCRRSRLRFRLQSILWVCTLATCKPEICRLAQVGDWLKAQLSPKVAIGRTNDVDKALR